MGRWASLSEGVHGEMLPWRACSSDRAAGRPLPVLASIEMAGVSVTDQVMQACSCFPPEWTHVWGLPGLGLARRQQAGGASCLLSIVLSTWPHHAASIPEMPCRSQDGTLVTNPSPCTHLRAWQPDSLHRWQGVLLPPSTARSAAVAFAHVLHPCRRSSGQKGARPLWLDND